jgi:hypothetical protein
MFNQLDTHANKVAEPSPTHARALSDSNRTQPPPPHETPYKPYSEKPPLSELPYKPYGEKPAMDEAPYEPYKGI